MSTQEEKNEANMAAPDRESAPAEVAEEGQPSTPSEDQSAARNQPTSSNRDSVRTLSRFYSRLTRGLTIRTANTAIATGPVFSDGIDPDDLAALHDNLPVDPPAGAESADTSSSRAEASADRKSRSRRSRDREGTGSARKDESANAADGERRERKRRRGEKSRAATDNEAGPTPSADETGAGPDKAPAAKTESAESPAESASRIRFEDAPAEPRRSAVQEFKPSRDRSYARDAARARRERTDTSSTEKKPSGLLGWMKTVFGAGSDTEEASGPAETARPHPQPAKSNAAASDGTDRPKRRRRRRGGRNRNRRGKQGGASSGGSPAAN